MRRISVFNHIAELEERIQCIIVVAAAVVSIDGFMSDVVGVTWRSQIADGREEKKELGEFLWQKSQNLFFFRKKHGKHIKTDSIAAPLIACRRSN